MRRAWLAAVALLASAALPSHAHWAAWCAHAAPVTPAPAELAALRRSAQASRAQREPRAEALSDYLLAQAGGDEGEHARQRLQGRARISTDPLVTVLALHMPCLEPGCRNVDAAQWSRLEPANALAWLALGGSGNEAHVLHQVAERARYLRGYQTEVAGLLRSAASTGPALHSPWALASLHALAGPCRQGPGDTGRTERCDKVAELLWQDGGATERLAALLLVHRQALLPPVRRDVWAARLRELQAVTRWLSAAGIDRESPATRREVCAAFSPPLGAPSSTWGEWERAVLVLQANGMNWRGLRARGGVLPWPESP